MRQCCIQVSRTWVGPKHNATAMNATDYIGSLVVAGNVLTLAVEFNTSVAGRRALQQKEADFDATVHFTAIIDDPNLVRFHCGLRAYAIETEACLGKHVFRTRHPPQLPRCCNACSKPAMPTRPRA